MPAVPLSNWLGDIEGPKWELKPPPFEGYPRLVRAHCETSVDAMRRDGANVLNEITPLYEHIPAWREGKPCVKLKRDVLRLAQAYGAPYRDDDNTLEAWLVLAAIVHTFMSALRVLQESGYEAMRVELEDRRSELTRNPRKNPTQAQWNYARIVTPKLTKEGWLFNLDHVGDMELNALNLFISWAMLHEMPPYTKEVTASSLKREVAYHLFHSFQSGVSGGEGQGRLVPDIHGVVAYCNVYIWAQFKLSELWRNGQEVQACPVCGTLFAPNHGNRRYCRRGTCAYKQHKLNQKARTTQP